MESLEVWDSPSIDLNRLRGERAGKEGVGRDEREGFLRRFGLGMSDRRTNGLMWLFLLCFLRREESRVGREDE